MTAFDFPARSGLPPQPNLIPGDGSRLELIGLNIPALARKIGLLMEGPLAGRRLLVVAPTALEAEDLAGDLGYFWPGGRVGVLAGLEIKPFIGQYVGYAPTAERLSALSLLKARGSSAVVTSSMASACRLVPPPASLAARTLEISIGQELGFERLKSYLEDNGYRRVGLVESVSDYAVRGGLVDVFPGGSSRPVRIDFFGDHVDSLRAFQVSDQRSVGSLETLSITPASHGSLGPAGRERAAKAVTELAREKGWLSLLWKPLVRTFLEGLQGDLDSWSPLFAEPLAPITDHLAGSGVAVLVLEPERALEAGRAAWLGLSNHFQRLALEERPHLPLEALHANPDDLWRAMASLPQGLTVARALAVEDAGLGPGAGPAGGSVRFNCEGNDDLRAMMSVPRRASGLLGPLAARIRALLGRGLDVRLVLRTRESSRRLAEMLVEYDLSPTRGRGGRAGQGEAGRPRAAAPRGGAAGAGSAGAAGGGTSLGTAGGTLAFDVGQISGGYAAPYDNEAVIAEDEIFGNRQRLRRRAREEFRGLKGFSSLKDLSPGDFVVHQEHGIGQYLGLVTLNLTNGQPGDFLHLTYRGGDILYVPVERFKSVSKYVGPGEHVPLLDRLGSGSWERIKGKVKDNIREMAEELLRLYAARQTAPGFSFSGRDQALTEFEASFQYDPTPDQERAIDEVLADLAAPRPMDRLVCGDVGYGKTEVAMRAAFKAVSDGKQVAVLVPTTILAEQHEKSFRERLADWPMVVESLSRFKKPAEQREIVKRVAQGVVDVLIGTHRILQKDIHFKDLGLLVIDEEHRFGVKDKERLKKLRTHVDVLSMSATPIPRSLSMSLNGVRDMSLIETSPQDRLAVRTRLMNRNDETIGEAIDFELARGGQVFFIHNQIRDIGALLKRLSEQMPLVRFGMGHGQMNSDELERALLRFLNKEIDVWVTTAIVESGLDFPAANTIIIDKADTFGLAQLYQLRGRVGRGREQAYAYLLVDNPETLTADARKRLKALMDHTDLGSGYQIALHDLQIRGSGNILGSAQSGQASLVGYEMYSQLMEQTIRELKNEPFAEDYDPEVILGLPAYLPESYAPDTEVRLGLYRRLSSAGTEEEVAELEAEMLDRLGPLPDEALNLLDLMRVKIRLRRARVRRLEGSESFLTLTFGAEGPADHDKIMALVAGSGQRRNRLTPQGKLVVGQAEYARPGRPLEGIREFLGRIA
jgi:transcription-repair coupling factor (superfamily II helicase)